MEQIAIIGAGPAGLVAAEKLAQDGREVTVYDRMPSPGRKFLMAGRGGLNITHSEVRDSFLSRYGSAMPWLAPGIDAFSPDDLRRWCAGLGQETFVGSSGRVFPKDFKAAPLLRTWLRRLDGLGVRFVARHRLVELSKDRSLLFDASNGKARVTPDAILLALGGASWPRMGSDGGWVEILRENGVGVANLRPSNCGAIIAWSPVFASRFEGEPLKRIALRVDDETLRGEAVITREGLEGGAIYAMSARLREALALGAAPVRVFVDLLPDISAEALAGKLNGPRQGRSLGNFLRQAAGLSPVATGLVREAMLGGCADIPLSKLVKGLPLEILSMQPIRRAISSAGGVELGAVDSHLMLREMPGIFVAGEMLDWEAPTGGYLLQACFSTGVWAANGISGWLERNKQAVVF